MTRPARAVRELLIACAEYLEAPVHSEKDVVLPHYVSGWLQGAKSDDQENYRLLIADELRKSAERIETT